MKLHLQKLQLSDRERSIGILVLISLFVAVNYVFIFPAVAKWRDTNRQIDEQQKTLKTTVEFIRRQPDWKGRIAELAPFLIAAQASQWTPDAAETKLQDLITDLAARHNVRISATSAVGRESSVYFEELVYNIRNYSAETSDLINFLYALTQQQQLLQVRALTISPPRNPNDPRISGDMTIVNLIPKAGPVSSLLALLPPGTVLEPAVAPTEPTEGTAAETSPPLVATDVGTNALDTAEVPDPGTFPEDSDGQGLPPDPDAGAETDPRSGQDATEPPSTDMIPSDDSPDESDDSPAAPGAVAPAEAAGAQENQSPSDVRRRGSTTRPDNLSIDPRNRRFQPSGESSADPRIRGMRMPMPTGEATPRRSSERSAPRVTIRNRDTDEAEPAPTEPSPSDS